MHRWPGPRGRPSLRQWLPIPFFSVLRVVGRTVLLRLVAGQKTAQGDTAGVPPNRATGVKDGAETGCLSRLPLKCQQYFCRRQ